MHDRAARLSRSNASVPLRHFGSSARGQTSGRRTGDDCLHCDGSFQNLVCCSRPVAVWCRRRRLLGVYAAEITRTSQSINSRAEIKSLIGIETRSEKPIIDRSISSRSRPAGRPRLRSRAIDCNFSSGRTFQFRTLRTELENTSTTTTARSSCCCTVCQLVGSSIWRTTDRCKIDRKFKMGSFIARYARCVIGSSQKLN